jgi:hypothetical protein
MQKKNVLRIIVGTGLILLIPLIAMQFTSEMNWDLTDFVVIAVLLIGSGLIYELFASRIRNPKHRIILAIVVIFAVLLIWADLAVGVFNIPGFSGS